MFVPANTQRSGPRTRRARGLACGLALLALTGCDTTMKMLVGVPQGTDKQNAPAPPTLPPPTTAFIMDSDLSPNFSSQTILPPTLPPNPNAAADIGAEPVVAPGPRKAIAAAPLSSDPKALAELGAAANREPNLPDAHFVLLVLTPPAGDAGTLDRETTKARQAVKAALKAMADSGVPAEQVDVSLATSPNAGAGEMRLYRR